jgi:hypothetical protein
LHRRRKDASNPEKPLDGSAIRALHRNKSRRNSNYNRGETEAQQRSLERLRRQGSVFKRSEHFVVNHGKGPRATVWNQPKAGVFGENDQDAAREEQSDNVDDLGQLDQVRKQQKPAAVDAIGGKAMEVTEDDSNMQKGVVESAAIDTQQAAGQIAAPVRRQTVRENGNSAAFNKVGFHHIDRKGKGYFRDDTVGLRSAGTGY